MGDWLKLAPALGIESDAPVRLLLLAPAFGPRSLAAARAVDPEGIDLAAYRCVRNGAETDVLLEPVRLSGGDVAVHEDPTAVADVPFRTGLTDADLGLGAAERRLFD